MAQGGWNFPNTFCSSVGMVCCVFWGLICKIMINSIFSLFVKTQSINQWSPFLYVLVSFGYNVHQPPIHSINHFAVLPKRGPIISETYIGSSHLIKGTSDLKQNEHNKRHHFLAQNFIPFLRVWFVWFRVLALETNLPFSILWSWQSK